MSVHKLCTGPMKDDIIFFQNLSVHPYQPLVIVKYLGHIVSAEGISTDPEKVSSISNWPRPTTAKELRSFLGLTGYYRRFIEGYSKIAGPLHSLTSLYGYSHIYD